MTTYFSAHIENELNKFFAGKGEMFFQRDGFAEMAAIFPQGTP